MYLITGGAGFIGSHIANELVARGADVRVFDNFSSGKRENLSNLVNQIEVVEGDLRDAEAVRNAVANVDVVFHLGAVPSVPRSIADPGTSMDVNVRGTLNVLLAARDQGCKRVVFASSSSVYGNTLELPKRETFTPRPLSPYAISKLSGEQLCGVFTSIYGLETVALRYFNVFGPRQDPNSQYSAVIPKFLKTLAESEKPTVYGDGGQSRDFTFVSNVVHANLLASVAFGAAGGVFNIASGKAISLNQLLTEIGNQLTVVPLANYTESRIGDVRDSLADISRAREVLGYEVLVPFEEGLRATIAATIAPELAVH